MSGAAVAAARSDGADAGVRRSWGQVIFSPRGAVLGYSLAACALVLGWLAREANPLTAEEGLGYALGIVGGSLMLIILLYSARKRVRFLRRFGATKHWFRIHMMMGVVGPLLILYHCNFDIGSLNSQVALYCTLLVAGSGVIGRYLYSQIHQGLYGRKSSLVRLAGQLQSSNEQLSSSRGLIREIRERLIELGNEAMEPPASLAQSLVRPVTMGIRTRWLYHRLSWVARKELVARSMTSAAVGEHQDRLMNTTRRFLQQHLTEIRRVAQFGFYERLFSWWHTVHVPFLFMMVLSGIVHVLAVHMY